MIANLSPEWLREFEREDGDRRRLRIYIAHSYGRRRELSLESLQRNVNSSIKYGLEIIKMGHNPFIPNLYHYVHLMANGTIPEETFIDLMTEWVGQCDALFVATLPEGKDSGVQIEIDTAESLGIPVYYSLEEIKGK